MATVQTWTLWQRMPPRYQLTSRYMEEEPDETLSVSGDKNLGSSRASSRPQSSMGRSPRQKTPPPLQRESFMLSTHRADATNENTIPSSSTTATASVPQKPSFPKRNSDYLNHLQQQKRVNSARRRIAESPPLSNDVLVLPPSSRAQTAPVFPVTSPDICKERKQSSYKVLSPVPSANKDPSNSVRPLSRPSREPTKVDMFQFDDSKSVPSANLSRRISDRDPPKAKKYLITDTDRSTMYIDDGKVICFGKSRHDLTQLLKTQSLRADRSSCFLAELRRDYLNHPKYDKARLGVKFNKRSEDDPRRIAHERVDYNQRVQHILSYYSEGTITEEMRKNQAPMSRPSSAVRVTSPTPGRRKGLSLTTATASTQIASPRFDRDLSCDFMKLNKKSKLHERQFYLRTPGMRHDMNVRELEKCRCSMCRMELQLALVTSVGGNLEPQTTGTTPRDHLIATNIDDLSIQSVQDVQNMATSGRKAIETGSNQRVQFKDADMTSLTKERKIINCKLPEVGDGAVSEAGPESARTQECVSALAS